MNKWICTGLIETLLLYIRKDDNRYCWLNHLTNDDDLVSIGDQ
nr:hypothetical protein [Mycoplasmopsis bovis]